MTTRPKRSCILSLLTCLLTLAASGDDIDIWRVAVPSGFDDCQPLVALGDENMDFLKSSDPAAWHPCRCHGAGVPVVDSSWQTASVTPTGSPMPLGAAREASRHVPWNGHITPLLC